MAYKLSSRSAYRFAWSINGLDVRSINFYDKNGIVYHRQDSHLKPLTDKNEPSSFTSQTEMFELPLCTYPNYRRKETFNRAEHYYLKNTESSYETTLEMYIYVGEGSEFKLEKVGETKSVYNLNGANMHSYYDVFQLSGKNLIEPIYIATCTGSKEYKTNIGKQADTILEHLKAKNYHHYLDKYELCKLLEVLDIKIKK